MDDQTEAPTATTATSGETSVETTPSTSNATFGDTSMKPTPTTATDGEASTATSGDTPTPATATNGESSTATSGDTPTPATATDGESSTATSGDTSMDPTPPLEYKDFASQVPTRRLDLVLDALSDKPDEHLALLAARMENWRKDFLSALDLKIRDIRWIEEHYFEDMKQREGFLKLWKSRSKDRATYGRVLKACVQINNRECAQLLIDLLKEIPAEKFEGEDESDGPLQRLYYLDKEAPTFNDLFFVKNKQGEVFKLLQQLATKWRDIGNVLNIETSYLDIIQEDNEHKVERCVERVFTYWIENAAILPKKRDYPCSWSGLQNLLNDCSMGMIAEQYFKVLETVPKN